MTLLVSLKLANDKLLNTYFNNESFTLLDRNNDLISLSLNSKDFYATYKTEIKADLKKLILQKEDKYFHFHLGFNPISSSLNVLSKLGLTSRNGSSTITEQLAKILLNNENKRTFKNKLQELFYAFSLELFNSKDTIFLMYANSIYFGNQIQGIQNASLAYFNSSPESLTKEQMLQLVATINSPNYYNPKELENIEKAKTIASKANENYFLDAKQAQANLVNFKKQGVFPLELNSFKNQNAKLSLDFKLNELLRKVVKENIESLGTRKAKNAAVIVIKIPENEVLALIGTPDQTSLNDGYQINMLKEERQIASTIKPFIYLKAFEKGMRPYTLINDKEYKYFLEDLSSFYPKNYNFKYNGEITAHYALSNSINVGALKTLEYVGLETFYNFLENDLEKKTTQNIESYGLGIAMGSLEMNLIDLAHIFTIFPNNGILKDLTLDLENKTFFEKEIADEKYIQLVNKILNDRDTGIDQFGLVSLLNLPQTNYALKTGTSVDFKDSLIVGYTPDFLVAVWVGNADSSKTEGLTGGEGAGLIWNNIMDIMLESKYSKNTPFNFNEIQSFKIEESVEWGLKGDDILKARNLLKDDSLILNLHNNDVFLFDPKTQIKLLASESVQWFIDEKEIFNDFFKPSSKGKYKITAKSKDKEETIFIYFE